jgi:Cu2+-containing amine oxidase
MGAADFHPLDSLTSKEIFAVSASCAAHHAISNASILRFNTISLLEPPKSVLLSYDAGTLKEVPRKALAILEIPPESGVIEVVLLISNGFKCTIESWVKKTDVQAMMVCVLCFVFMYIYIYIFVYV